MKPYSNLQALADDLQWQAREWKQCAERARQRAEDKLKQARSTVRAGLPPALQVRRQPPRPPEIW